MKSFKENYIDDVEIMNKILSFCKLNKYECDNIKLLSQRNYFIDWAKIKFKLYCSYDLTNNTNSKLPQMFIFKMDGTKASQDVVTGRKAFTQLQKMSNNAIVDFSQEQFKGIFWNIWDETKGKPIWSTGYQKPYMYFNPKYNNTRLENCYGYDVNSAYPFALTKDMPDCTNYRVVEDWWSDDAIVKDNEMGFINKDGELEMVETGFHAQYIFQKIKSPFIKFVNHYMKDKINAITKENKQHAKNYMNYAIGYILRKNPFIHCAVLYHSKEYIKSKVDENTLFSNTDSIVSKVKREDLEIGKALGQFKIEHIGDFAYKGYNYQWNVEKPSYRGISKEWFENGFDILKDDVPTMDNNKYRFNTETFQIELND